MNLRTFLKKTFTKEKPFDTFNAEFTVYEKFSPPFTYYVDSIGDTSSDANSGLYPNQAFKSLEHALSVSNKDDKIILFTEYNISDLP
jgi:hypothetical protein